jgi:hypothetical protein
MASPPLAVAEAVVDLQRPLSETAGTGVPEAAVRVTALSGQEELELLVKGTLVVQPHP